MKDNSSAFHSDEYDDKISRTLPYYEEFYKQIMEVIKIAGRKPLTWLDAGCGTGKMAELALRQTSVKKFVFCDSSPEMIDIVKMRYHFPNTEFLLCDIRHLDLKNDFDVITAIQVNHYFHREERKAAIKSCYQALKLNGLYFSFENFAPFTHTGEQLYLDRWEAYQLEQGKSPSECKEHRSRYQKNYFPITLWEHMDALRDCGFCTVEILWLSYMQVGLLAVK